MQTSASGVPAKLAAVIDALAVFRFADTALTSRTIDRSVEFVLTRIMRAWIR
ncbi:hypothetical protein SMD44_07807 [Streptomyces alboflavus]|uniref:Uncharacterized protein n=1 Tax=Streptomyces alboflavus TaxID=67267 RepID=A0A1Z1WPJ6_9ACTN|nr:hypothetical protein SMD44_07807 [Streptomyces alboflavus]